MAEANAHYYATRDPLGAAGDFTTAPEISQMFGELVGLGLADVWARAGRPEPVHYVELGPGRGTLAADALRAMRAAGLRPYVHLVETSPTLRAAQSQRLAGATWHDDVDGLPGDAPLLVVANEFFDALPVHQLLRTESGWRELVVTWGDDRFRRVAGPPRPWLEARASYDRAARVLALGLGTDSEEHLTELVLTADPSAHADLQARSLAPLDKLRASSAEKLVETLRSWLLHHGRRDAVAAELFVHPQTVRYRMGQLREIFGDRLEDPRSILELTLAVGLVPADPVVQNE